MRLSQVMRKLLSCLKQLGGGNLGKSSLSCSSSLGLPFITKAFPGKKGQTYRSNNDQSSCLAPLSRLNAQERWPCVKDNRWLSGQISSPSTVQVSVVAWFIRSCMATTREENKTNPLLLFFLFSMFLNSSCFRSHLLLHYTHWSRCMLAWIYMVPTHRRAQSTHSDTHSHRHAN